MKNLFTNRAAVKIIATAVIVLGAAIFAKMYYQEKPCTSGMTLNPGQSCYMPHPVSRD